MANSGQQFVAALISNVVLFVVFVSLFMCCRNRNKMTYQPRALRPGALVQPVSTGVFSWIYDTLFLYSDETIYRASGIDLVMYLRYLRMVAIIMFVQIFFGAVVLFPIHATGEFANGRPVSVSALNGTSTLALAEMEGLQRVAMTNVAPESNRLVAHIFSVVINTFITMYLFSKDYDVYINYRLRSITECRSQNYTLMITEMPVNTMSEVQMEQALAKTYGRMGMRRRRDQTKNKVDKEVEAKASAKEKEEAEERRREAETLGEHKRVKTDTKEDQAMYVYDKSKQRYIEGTLVDLDLVYVMPDLTKRIAERNAAELALEAAIAQAKTRGIRPTHTPDSMALSKLTSLVGGGGQTSGGPVDSIEFHAKRVQAADADIAALRALVDSTETDLEYQKRPKGLDTVQTGFARLSSIFAVRAGVQRQLVKQALPGASCYRAPDPKAIIWENLSITRSGRAIRKVLVGIFLFGLIFFWAIPMTFIQGVANLRNLFKLFGDENKVNDVPPAIAAWIEGFLPTLLIIIFNILLPIIIRFAGTLMGIFTQGLADDFLFTRLFAFKVFNVFLATTIAGAILQKLDEMKRDPSFGAIVNLFGQGLSGQSTFFINYILIIALSGIPLQLWRPGPLIVRWIMRKWVCKTPRDFEAADQPEPSEYEIKYADHALIFMITLTYSTTSPFIVLWGLIYFCLAFVVNRYNILFVWIPAYNASGMLWRSAYDCILWGLLIYHIFMIFIFLTYEFFAGAAVSFLIMFATFGFWVLIADRGERNFQSRVLAAAAAADVVNAVHRDEMFAKTRHSFRQPELQPEGTQLPHYVAHPPKVEGKAFLEAALRTAGVLPPAPPAPGPNGARRI